MMSSGEQLQKLGSAQYGFLDLEQQMFRAFQDECECEEAEKDKEDAAGLLNFQDE